MNQFQFQWLWLRGLAEGKVEVKHRKSGEKEMMSLAAAIDKLGR